MPIAQLGTVNISALSVPQALVQIVPPQFLFNGVSTNGCGLVGTAAWGPVNIPQTFGNYSQFASIFGPTINRKYDLGGNVILAASQGAAYFSGVRVTDGTDTAATIATIQTAAVAATGSIAFTANPIANSTMTLNGTAVTFVASGATSLQVNIGANLAATLAAALTMLSGSADTQLVKFTYAATGSTLKLTAATAGTAGNALTVATTVVGATVAAATLTGGLAAAPAITFTGKYTGSLGNSIKVSVGPGTQATSYKLIVSCPNQSTEVFDNLAAGLSGNAVWVALAAAVNSGSSSVRPASGIIVASAGVGIAAPTTASYTLSGGTDGGSISATAGTIMLGVDSVPRTGMYALRGTNVARFSLCDLDDDTTLSTQLVFGLDIGAEAIQARAASDTLSTAASALTTAGVDSPWLKVIYGDWIIWNDTINGVPQRMTSPAAIALGRRGALSPEQSVLNKPILGIVGTQSSLLGKVYSYADFQAIAAARMDLVALDPTLSNSFIFRLGLNTSSNPVINGDQYTDVTNFMAKSLNIIAANFIGRVQNPDERREARVAIQEFCGLAQRNGIIGTADGSQAYQVVLDDTNNPQASVALGYQFAYVKAIYLGIVKFFIINLEGGASVTISDTQPA